MQPEFPRAVATVERRAGMPGGPVQGMPPAAAPIPPGTVDLREIVGCLRQRVRLIAVCAALGVAMGVVFLAVVPPKYKATAQIIIDPRGLQVLDKEVNPRPQSEVHVPLVENEMRVLKSTALLDRVIDRENLLHDPEFLPRRWLPLRTVKVWLASLVGRERREADPRIEVMRELDDRIAVRRADRSFVVDITVSTEDPVKSARLANSLVDAYFEESAAAEAEAARRAGQALDGRLEELQSRVREAEDRVEQFKRQNNIVGASGRLVSEQQLSELNNQLGLAKARTSEARTRLQQIRTIQSSPDAGAFGGAVQSQLITTLRAQYADAQRRYASLATEYGDKHPALTGLHSEMKKAEASITAEVARIARSAQLDYDSARANEESLEATVREMSRTTLSTNQAMVQLRELEREVDAGRAVYQAALVRSRELREQTLLNTTNVRRTTVAVPPLGPALSSGVVLALGAVLGLLLGATLALFGRTRRTAGPARASLVMSEAR